ncbi:unnamed protein product [Oikopleura dioica]|uniref:Cytochrome c domain-containing protein n=2 Tax=Oikopleura dioica TaxID=34765 RepID=E4XDV3_OIKDI|nr:unnamed protein product [Oikopleura dioica]
MQAIRRLTAGTLAGGAVGTFFVSLDGFTESKKAKASGGGPHLPTYEWDFNKFGNALDAAALRRGWYVYQKVCSTCHSLQYFYFRELIGKSHTEAEVKKIAKEFECVDDSPDDEGNPVTRACKPYDNIPKPYANEKAARAANAGALPPDLSLICWAREGEENYLYSLLTGYCDPPAGVTVADGMNYNAYFAGGAIGMAQPIYNETVDYKEMGDDTPPYMSQIAKDIVTFLRYSTDVSKDNRQLALMRILGMFVPVFFLSVVATKKVFSPGKTMKVVRSEDLRKFK